MPIKRFSLSPLALLALLFCAACAPVVATQNIPVATNPLGAKVLANGKVACPSTPCTVTLERNQDHILSIQKDGYLQQDVVIKQEYQTADALVSAINSGYGSGSFHKSVAMGVQAGVMNKKYGDETGDNYRLEPSAVSIRLVPTAGFPRTATESDVAKIQSVQVSPLEFMASQDETMLESVINTSPTGKTTVWTNDSSKTSFAVIPEEATVENGQVVRWFTLGARKGNDEFAGRYPAYRSGRGEWSVNTVRQTSTPSQSDTKQVIRALGNLNWPTATKKWDSTVSSSSNTSVTSSGPGQTTTTTTSSKTKVGASVSASPGAAIKILDALGLFGN